MKVILNNGLEVNPLIVKGEKRNVQDARRDCLTFVFPEMSLDEADGIFTAENCEKIKIIENSTKTVQKEVLNEETGETVLVNEVIPIEIEYIHNGYTIRVDLNKFSELKEQATATSEAVYETRVSVTMAERTYAETKLMETSEAVDAVMVQMLMM